MKKLILFVLSSFVVFGCSRERNRKLHIYSWADYIPQEVIQDFEKKYGCEVYVDSFDSNESAYAKLKAGASGYDICIPSSYMVEQMKREGMISALDVKRLDTVVKNFDHRYDPQVHDCNFSYSVPYVVTYTGLMGLKDVLGTNDVSWSVFSDAKLRQKVSMLDDIREVIGAGLMYLGYSINSENETEIDKAVDVVLKWKGNVRKFDAESYKTEVANRSIHVGHAYSSDSLQVIFGDDCEDSSCYRDDITFVLPKEGFTIAWDEIVVMNSSENKDLAYDFMNFIYETENSRRIIVYNLSIMPNAEAIGGLPDKLADVIVLDDETLKRGQVMRFFKNAGTVELYNKAWDRIKKTR